MLRWVANKQARAAQAYLPQVRQVWYEQALASGLLQDIATVARELGEESIALGKRGLLYTWQISAITVHVDDADGYLTVHTGEQLVCSTQPTSLLFIPGHWLHVLAPYMERAHLHEQVWQTMQQQWGLQH
ncbi:MAG: hypothetical protein U0350_02555 [Caldilineaceae bacterium]